MKQESAKRDDARCASHTDPLNKKSTYTVSGRRFIVTPVFRDSGGEALDSILIRMMKADVVQL